MAYEKKPLILKWGYNPGDYYPGDPDSRCPSFDTVLNATCERLWEKHARYSIRRIQEMNEELEKLERDLDEFIGPQIHVPKVSDQNHAQIK